MKLYYSPAACSLSPHIVAREAGIDLDLVKVDLKAKTTADGADYTKVNAKGYVPALALDDGQVLTEGPAIVQYLADRKPASGLAPAAGTLERYRLQEWLNFITAEIHKPMGSLFNAALPEASRQASRDTLAKRLAYLAQHLQGKAWLGGERYSVADAYLYTVLNWAGFVKFDLSPWPLLQQYVARVAARPAVQAALRAEGLVK